MKCPDCGGVPQHLVTDIDGKPYYRCHTGLTGIDDSGSRVGHTYPCDTVIDEQCKVLPYGTHIAYITDNKVKTLTVTKVQ